jgi:ribosomal protein S1
MVTLGDGIDGLVHISEFSDEQPVRPGTVFDGKDLRIDTRQRRIFLSLRRTRR